MPLEEAVSRSQVSSQDTKIIIFTSGSTGLPKGVKLSYSNYKANKGSFQALLGLEDEAKIKFCPVVVNPMHHTNSTSITDWALRRRNTTLILVQRYSTSYWKLISSTFLTLSTQIQEEEGDNSTTIEEDGAFKMICPMVSRHIDFLDHLWNKTMKNSQQEEDESLILSPPSISTLQQLKEILGNIVFLLGSAPVGPTTVERIQKVRGRLPTVRFGSTETTLQVVGIPNSFSQSHIMSCFERGWEHKDEEGNLQPVFIYFYLLD